MTCFIFITMNVNLFDANNVWLKGKMSTKHACDVNKDHDVNKEHEVNKEHDVNKDHDVNKEHEVNKEHDVSKDSDVNKEYDVKRRTILVWPPSRFQWLQHTGEISLKIAEQIIYLWELRKNDPYLKECHSTMVQWSTFISIVQWIVQ